MHLLLIWTPPRSAALPVGTASWLNSSTVVMSYELEVLERAKNEAVTLMTIQIMVDIPYTNTLLHILHFM